jgi:hypothetical protein
MLIRVMFCGNESIQSEAEAAETQTWLKFAVISCPVKQLSLKLTQRQGSRVGGFPDLSGLPCKDAKGLQSFYDKSLGGLDIKCDYFRLLFMFLSGVPITVGIIILH